MNFLLGLLVVFSIVNAKEVLPLKTLQTSAPILDFIIRGGAIWAGSADGKILEISTKGKILSTHTLPLIANGSEGETVQKVMSVDLSPDGTKLAAAGEDGTLYIIRGVQRYQTHFKTNTVIKKIAFVSNEEVVLALLSNELVWFNLQKNQIQKRLSIGTSPLSDIAVAKDLLSLVTVGEAGVVRLVDTQKRKLIKTIHGGNVDNIYKVDYQNRRIITAGQDRRVIIYSDDGKKYMRFDGSFLIYAAALSPKAKRFAAPMDEENRLSFFDLDAKQTIALGKGHDATLNRIVFIDEKHLVSSADENKILFWEIP